MMTVVDHVSPWRDLLAQAGVAKRYAHGACDIDIDGSKASGHQ